MIMMMKIMPKIKIIIIKKNIKKNKTEKKKTYNNNQ